jgi:hypothetical protein
MQFKHVRQLGRGRQFASWVKHFRAMHAFALVSAPKATPGKSAAMIMRNPNRFIDKKMKNF